ncbi:ABC-type antimicrobial peptide transport system, ATPase component [Azospirillum argentinense]
MPRAGGPPLIKFKGVSNKVFGSGPAAVPTLNAVDLSIDRGEFVAIMGTSGSGKSTAMNILGCLDAPTSGTYRFMGVDVGRLNRHQRTLLRRRYLGFVFQGFNLLARTSAVENVELPLVYRALPRPPAAGLRGRFWPVSGWKGARTTRRANCPAASSSVSPLPAPSSPIPPFCWPTSRPAISTAG